MLRQNIDLNYDQQLKPCSSSKSGRRRDIAIGRREFRKGQVRFKNHYGRIRDLDRGSGRTEGGREFHPAPSREYRFQRPSSPCRKSEGPDSQTETNHRNLVQEKTPAPASPQSHLISIFRFSSSRDFPNLVQIPHIHRDRNIRGISVIQKMF